MPADAVRAMYSEDRDTLVESVIRATSGWKDVVTAGASSGSICWGWVVANHESVELSMLDEASIDETVDRSLTEADNGDETGIETALFLYPAIYSAFAL